MTSMVDVESMDLFHWVLISASFLSSLLAGLLFAFSVVVMPGIKNLNDSEFIRSFQAIDQVIQDNQPLFLLVWIGSVVTLVLAAVLGVRELHGWQQSLLVMAALTAVFSIHLPTVVINIPLNNRLQALKTGAMTDEDLESARADFEGRWNRWNQTRTAFACLVCGALLILLLVQ